MKVTAVKQQAKRADRYSVYVDGKYTFSLHERQLIAVGLHSGQELTKAELEAFQSESAEGKLFDKLLNVLSYRPRSEWELRDYLRRKQAEPEVADKLIEKLRELRYVDDEAFARAWVESRMASKPTSRRKLKAELQAKRVDLAIIDNALEETTDSASDLAAIQQLIEKKRARYPDETKLMQYLARQGFSYGDIRTALEHQD
jgi:regulatory protein